MIPLRLLAGLGVEYAGERIVSGRILRYYGTQLESIIPFD